MLTSLRTRPQGEHVVAAFRRFIVEPGGLLGSDDPDAIPRIQAATRLIAGSRALLARERELYDRYTLNLAALIAKERRLAPDDVEPRVTAHALIGVQRAVLDDVRRQVLAGRTRRTITRSVRVQGGRAMDLLERGLTGSDSQS
jgi:hypothetical protein